MLLEVEKKLHNTGTRISLKRHAIIHPVALCRGHSSLVQNARLASQKPVSVSLCHLSVSCHPQPWGRAYFPPSSGPLPHTAPDCKGQVLPAKSSDRTGSS